MPSWWSSHVAILVCSRGLAGRGGRETFEEDTSEMWPGGSGAARTERTGEKKDFSERASEFRCLSVVGKWEVVNIGGLQNQGTQ